MAPEPFDLKKIAESGQCFRMKELPDGTFLVPSGDRAIICTRDGRPCGDPGFFDAYWHSYFDLDRSYNLLGSVIMTEGDDHLKEAYELGKGIRILKQDLWEIIVSFMISQNNNIKRIAGSVEKLCKLGGKEIEGFPGVYAFPEASELPLSVFEDASLGLGYRAGFIREMFEFTAEHPEWLTELKKASYEDAKRILMEKKGIGPKVSDCICLFALGHVDAFPIDTHVKQLLAKYYPGGINLAPFAGFAGIIQQFLFYYELRGN